MAIFVSLLTPSTYASTTEECVGDFAQVSENVSRRTKLEALTDNPQIQIWDLEASGNPKTAARLKKKVAKILGSAKTKSIDDKIYSDPSHARNQPLLMKFEGGIQGVWKPLDERTKKELIAYRFDQRLGSKVVPITVEREHNGQRGVIQLFVSDTDEAHLLQRPTTLDLFDYLAAHIDRTDTNQLSFRGRTVAIDNENTFGIDYYVDDDFFDFDRIISDHLRDIAKAKNKEAAKIKAANQIAPTLISREVIENLMATTDRQWRSILTGLNPAEIQLFLDRKNRAISAIRQAEKVIGERMYPSGSFSGLIRNRWAGRLDQLEKVSERPDISRLMEQKILRAQELILNETSWRQTMTPEEKKEVDAILKEIDAIR